jgi:hypothetical protein
MKKTKYMVKYRSHGKWIGPYISRFGQYDSDLYLFNNLKTAKEDELYVRSATKCKTKIVKV